MIHLLDVCALIALGYPSHVHNQRVERWAADMRRNANEPVAFATCAITEPGFVRIGSADSERRFGHDVGSARLLLKRLKLRLPFVFIADDLGAEQLPQWVKKPEQTTDGHLLELARSRGATLATVDGGIPGALLIPFLPDTEWRVEEPAAHYGTAA